MDLKDYGWSVTATPVVQVFHLWDKDPHYDRNQWHHKDWFRKNRKKLLDLFTKYGFWEEDNLFALRLLEKTQWYSKKIWVQNQIIEGKVQRQPLGFDDPVKDKKALDEISFACQNLEKKLHRHGSASEFGTFYVAGYKLENQDVGFFHDLLTFLKEQKEGRKNILATSQRVQDHKKNSISPKQIKNLYWKPVVEFLLVFDALLDEFNVLPLPNNQKTITVRLDLMVEILEIMGADFSQGATSKNKEGQLIEPSFEEKRNRVKKWLIDAKKNIKTL